MRIRRFGHCMLAALLLSIGAAAHAQPFDGCPSTAIGAAFAEFGKTGRMPAPLRTWLGDLDGQRIAPFKAFDDAWFVGACWVSAWLLPTPQGHFLIDTLHEPHTAELLDSIRKAGFDPQDIRYVLITHGHYDHAGRRCPAEARAEERSLRHDRNRLGGGDRVGERVERNARRVGNDRARHRRQGRRCMDARRPHGDAARDAGPHAGTASYVFDVHDGSRAYRALTVGGLGLNAIQNARQVELYIESVERLDRMASASARPIEVHLTTHPFSTGLMEQRATLAGRKSGDAHPLVDPPRCARNSRRSARRKERLVVERAKAKN